MTLCTSLPVLYNSLVLLQDINRPSMASTAASSTPTSDAMASSTITLPPTPTVSSSNGPTSHAATRSRFGAESAMGLLVENLKDRVLFAIPKKGRLHEKCLELLAGTSVRPSAPS